MNILVEKMLFLLLHSVDSFCSVPSDQFHLSTSTRQYVVVLEQVRRGHTA